MQNKLPILGAIALIGAIISHSLSTPENSEAYTPMMFEETGTVQSSQSNPPFGEGGKKAEDCIASATNVLCMVAIDTSKLSPEQSQALEEITPTLPKTKIGKRCQYYGKPQVWCLLLDPAIAMDTQAKLSQFSGSLWNKQVRRLKAEGG